MMKIAEGIVLALLMDKGGREADGEGWREGPSDPPQTFYDPLEGFAESTSGTASGRPAPALRFVRLALRRAGLPG